MHSELPNYVTTGSRSQPAFAAVTLDSWTGVPTFSQPGSSGLRNTRRAVGNARMSLQPESITTCMSAWKRTFISAFVAQIFSIVGFSFCLPFLPFFIADLGVVDKAEQAWWAGIAMSSAGCTLAVFAPLWGILADRYGRKAMVVRAMLAGTVVLWLMSLVRTVGQLVLCRLLQGAFTGTVAASVALVASVTPPRRSGFTLGMMQTAVFLGVSLGPLAGGVVADHLGYRAAFRMGAVIILFGGLLVYYGTREDFTPPEPADRRVRGTFRKIMASPGFLAAVVVLLSVRFSNTLANPSFPLIVKDILGVSPRLNSVTGSIICVAALSGALSAAVCGHFGDRWGHKRILLLCSFSAAFVSVAHTFAQSIAYLFVVRALFGLTIAGMMPAANAIIRDRIHDTHIGRAYGAATSLSMLGFALGPFLGGYIGRTVGIRAPFVVTGISQMLVVAIVAFAIHDHPRPDTQSASGPH